jgi:hypothetical protein
VRFGKIGFQLSLGGGTKEGSQRGALGRVGESLIQGLKQGVVSQRSWESGCRSGKGIRRLPTHLGRAGDG